MSKYGLKIKNFQAGSLYEYINGVRDNLDYTEAMFTNSLFSNFIRENGMRDYNDKSTRDIICIEFEYGSRSFNETKEHLEDLLQKAEKELQCAEDKKIKDTLLKKIDKIRILIETAENNKQKFSKKTKEEIRKEFYNNGVEITYTVKNKTGKIVNQEKIKYKMLYRTPGKAKKGSCMFINEDIYDVAINFLRMGITLSDENAPIVEMGAYSSLITSTIVDTLTIKPEEILVIKDVDVEFYTDVITINTDKNKHCFSEKEFNYKLKNTLFDGQALIDTSIFPSWGDGYILLRHHMCKMAAFHTNIETFMKDYFKNDYDTAYVKDMWGRLVKVSDIKLITTDNAMKWLKFDKTFEYWSEWIRKNNCQFGIVKTAHESKLGNVQRMSYQMINALDMDIMDNVVDYTKKYVDKLKTDNEEFLKYLYDNKNFSNDYEVLVALCRQNPDFTRSNYFRDRKKDILKTYSLNFKNGRVIQNADNLVIVGSPYAMLLASVGENIELDDTFITEKGTIQCHTKRFDDNEYLACFRSPFNSKNNMGYLHNVYHEKFDKYFNFGKQIIAVNLIGTDFQDRNNGSDQDSDSIYTTNQPDIVECAKKYYVEYPTIVNNIPKDTKKYNNTMDNYANIDNALAAAQLAIGESSNLAQLCLTYTYNFDKDKEKQELYKKYVCILSVLAQVAIDNAKRKFDINLVEEIKSIKKDMNIKINKYPIFWTAIRRDFNKVAEIIQQNIYKIKNNQLNKNEIAIITGGITSFDEALDYLKALYKRKNKINKKLKCPMNYINDVKFDKHKDQGETIDISKFYVKYELEESRRQSKKIEELIEKYDLNVYKFYTNEDNDRDNDDDYLLLRSDYEDLIEDIKNTYISKNYLGLMSWLLNRAFCIGAGAKRTKGITQSIIGKNKSILLKILYDINSDALLKCFSGKYYENSEQLIETDMQKTQLN